MTLLQPRVLCLIAALFTGIDVSARAQEETTWVAPNVTQAVQRAEAVLREHFLGIGTAAGIVIYPEVGRGEVDPLRTIEMSELLASCLAGRGAIVHVATPGEPPRVDHLDLRISVHRDGERYLADLTSERARGNQGNEDSATWHWSVAFADKPWIEGDLEPSLHYRHSFKASGHGPHPEDAMRVAREAALGEIERRASIPSGLFPRDHVLARLHRWESDQFLGWSGAENPHEPWRCDLLIALSDRDWKEIHSASTALRNHRLVSWVTRGAILLTLLGGCLIGYLQLDLRTRGYLSGPLKAAFACMFAAGVALMMLLG